MFPPLLRLVATALILLQLPCFGLPFFGFGKEKEPVAGELAILYYPYPEMAAGGARPLPTYDDLWTVERMQRDCRRLAELGAKTVVVALQPDVVASQESHLDDCVRFIGIAVGAGLKTALIIATDPAVPISLPRREQEDLLEWLKKLSGRVPPASFVDAGGRLPVLLPRETARQWRVMDPTVAILPLENGPPANLPSVEVGDRTWIMVPVQPPTAFQGAATPSPSPQARHKRLETALSRLEPSWGVDVLFIDAWNNYARGLVLEPNTVDGDSCIDVLRTWTKQHLRH